MRLVVLLLFAAGLMWAALHPRDFVAGVYLVRDRAEEALGRARNEAPPPQSRAQRIYRAWQSDPVYDIDSLEALYLDTEHGMFLVHLAAATAKGCGDAQESDVLDANLDRIPTRWSGQVELMLARRRAQCESAD